MEIILLIARLFLVGIFGVAGVAKLADREGARRALTEFGVPERLTPALAWGLPIVELLVAFALIPLTTAWLGSTIALLLLLIFSVGVAVNLARGQAPDCHCFGQLHSEPVSWFTFTRNVVLAAVAALVVIFGKNNPGLSVVDWLFELRAAEIAGLLLGAVGVGVLSILAVFLRRVLKQQATLLEWVNGIRVELEDLADSGFAERKEAAPPQDGLPVGAMAPDFFLAAMSGGGMSLEQLLRPGKPVLLFFVSTNCLPCLTLLPTIREWEQEYSDQLTLALISEGTYDDIKERMTKYGLKYLLMQGDTGIDDEYQSKWTPAAVWISREGKIASPVTYGNERIRQLVEQIVSSAVAEVEEPKSEVFNGQVSPVGERRVLLKVGDLAPRFSLPDLTGGWVNMEDLLGSPTLLLFWHPQSLFCKAMLDDLRRWENHPSPGAPKLVFLAVGSMEEIMKINGGFKSLTLLDPVFDIGGLFGTKHAPSAIIIDGEGRIASSLAIGNKNVLALLGSRQAAPQLSSSN